MLCLSFVSFLSIVGTFDVFRDFSLPFDPHSQASSGPPVAWHCLSVQPPFSFFFLRTPCTLRATINIQELRIDGPSLHTGCTFSHVSANRGSLPVQIQFLDLLSRAVMGNTGEHLHVLTAPRHKGSAQSTMLC